RLSPDNPSSLRRARPFLPRPCHNARETVVLSGAVHRARARPCRRQEGAWTVPTARLAGSDRCHLRLGCAPPAPCVTGGDPGIVRSTPKKGESGFVISPRETKDVISQRSEEHTSELQSRFDIV